MLNLILIPISVETPDLGLWDFWSSRSRAASPKILLFIIYLLILVVILIIKRIQLKFGLFLIYSQR